MLQHTVLCDVILSITRYSLVSPAIPIVARGTQPRLGGVAIGLAVVVHAALLGLLLEIRRAVPDTDATPPIEVTLEISPETATSTAPPTVAPSDRQRPANDPEPQPAPPLPTPDPQPGPGRDASPPSSAASPQASPEPTVRPLRRSATPAAPVPKRDAVKPAARPAKFAVRPPAASKEDGTPTTPVPSAAPVQPSQMAAPVQQASVEATGAWRSALAAWLQEHRTYPEAARRGGVEGRVVVRFTMDDTGVVTAVVLVSGSGSTVLDEAAQALLRGAHLPPPPPPAPEHLSVTLPVRYSLAH